jgi:hypothetical protein
MFGGAITSVAANVAHVFVPPTGWNAGVSGRWVPPAGAVLGAVVWPLALLVASEVLARKRFASRWTRLLGTLAVLVVALVAAVISYQHLHDLLLYYRETQLSASIGPLGIDGLMVVCSVALVAADTPADTGVRTADTPVCTPRDTVPDTPVNTPADVSVLPVAACTDTPAAVSVHVSRPVSQRAPDAVSVSDQADADTLRTRGVRTLRGAQTELGAGRARAQRALALAWPDTP